MENKLAISFVLPTRDETESLRTTVAMILAGASEHLGEVLILLTNPPEEPTLQVARQLTEQHPEIVRIHTQQLPQLGGALREGFELASGSHVMLMASDLETDPELIPCLIEKMQEDQADIVTASRWLAGGSFQQYGCVKLLLNYLFQRSFRLLYRTRLTDLTFGYRLYRREVLQGIRWDELGFPFLLECLLKPLRLGARVVEVPCVWRGRSEGRSANSLWKMLTYVPVAIRIRLLSRERIRRRSS